MGAGADAVEFVQSLRMLLQLQPRIRWKRF
jgi:hypothetical protein